MDLNVAPARFQGGFMNCLFRRQRILLHFLVFLSFQFTSLNAVSQIQDVHVTDISDRAFSVVWAVDEAVNDADAAVFMDARGIATVESAVIDVLSGEAPAAHKQGLVKLSVSGLAPSSTYYVRLESSSLKKASQFPVDSSLLSVTTAPSLSFINRQGEPVINELMSYRFSPKDTLGTGVGRVVILDSPSLFSPISAFVGSAGEGNAVALFNLNNLRDRKGHPLELSLFKSHPLEITELHGYGVCDGLVGHRRTKYRQAPIKHELPKISSITETDSCILGDVNCDGAVDGTDLTLLTKYIGVSTGECLLNADFDINSDGIVDKQDAQELTRISR
jgi:Dockerin type I domain